MESLFKFKSGVTLFHNAKCSGMLSTSKMDDSLVHSKLFMKKLLDFASVLTLDLNIQWMAAKFVPFLVTDE
jgi:hypothetical protein